MFSSFFLYGTIPYLIKSVVFTKRLVNKYGIIPYKGSGESKVRSAPDKAKRDGYVALGSQVVDFVGLYLLENSD